MGLLELSKIDEKLFSYVTSLFSQNSKYFNRNMKSQDELNELDKQIENFLTRLSPFFKTSSCHKVLEFLIKIYQVNIYNSKTLLLSFIPFYNTAYFTKLIQNINLEALKTFSFLHQNAKMGITMLPDKFAKESSNFDFANDVFNFFKTIINNCLNASHYFTFCMEVISTHLNSRTSNENIIHLIFSFLKDSFSYISKSDRSQKDLLIKGLSEVIIKIVSKFNLSKEYLNVIVKEVLARTLSHSNKSDLMEVIIKTLLVILINKVIIEINFFFI